MEAAVGRSWVGMGCLLVALAVSVKLPHSPASTLSRPLPRGGAGGKGNLEFTPNLWSALFRGNNPPVPVSHSGTRSSLLHPHAHRCGTSPVPLQPSSGVPCIVRKKGEKKNEKPLQLILKVLLHVISHSTSAHVDRPGLRCAVLPLRWLASPFPFRFPSLERVLPSLPHPTEGRKGG